MVAQGRLPDVIHASVHGGEGGVVVLLQLAARQLRHTLALGFQARDQHPLVLQARIEQQLIEAGDVGAFPLEQRLGIKLLPPGADHRAAAEQSQLGRSDQAAGHGG